MALVTRQLTNTGSPLYTPDGVLLANKTVTFTLVNSSGAPTSAFDGMTGERVVGVVTTTTSAAGEFTVSLWPNDRGDKLTRYACTVDYPGAEAFTSVVPTGATAIAWLDFKLSGITLTPIELGTLAAHMTDETAHGAAGGVEDKAHKDATGGYAGLTLFKINFKNALNTFTSFFTNANTAARTYTFQNRDGTIADDTDISTHTHPATAVSISSVGTPAGIADLQDALNHMWSSGSVTGFNLTNNGNGTISLTAGEAMLRPTADEHDVLVSMAVDATTNLALTDQSINYVYVSYNAGTSVVQAGTSLSDFDCLSKCILYTVCREGTSLYWADARSQNVDPNRKHRRMLLECEGFRHINGGCMLSASGTRNIAVSAGGFYYGLARIAHDAFDTAVADTFFYYYRNGAGGWTKTTGNTQINNTQYDNGTGTLGTLSNNKFGVHWIYLILDTPVVLAVQFGQGDYSTVSDAEAAAVPAPPPTLAGVGVLVGQIVVQKSAAAFSTVAGAFTHSFTAGTVATHNALAGLQGGALSEYYHMTSTEHNMFTPLFTAYTVATLPAGAQGMRTYVTDATAPTWLATLTGGGAVVCPVFHNGTAWVAG